MDFKICMNNFPWNRFGTVYETSSKDLKERFVKIADGIADLKDFEFIIHRLEHQETLYRITPWGLKFYIHLLTEAKSNKSILLQSIITLFEAANYNSKCDLAIRYKPTKGNLAKYEQIKLKLFDNEFDGKMDADFLKTCKSIERNFMQISIIDYIVKMKPLFERFAESDDPEIAKEAKKLLNSIKNPRKFKFINENGIEEEY